MKPTLAVFFLLMISCSALVSRHPFARTLSTQTSFLAATMAPEAPTKSKSKDTEKKESSRSEREVQDKDDADLWEIRILDNDHHFDYQVAEILVKVANLSELLAFKAMRTAEKNGSCSIGEYDYEKAEHYVNALQDHYLGCEMNPLGFE
jgi:ATP-dependent Clp protease adapter protein ClpS